MKTPADLLTRIVSAPIGDPPSRRSSRGRRSRSRWRPWRLFAGVAAVLTLVMGALPAPGAEGDLDVSFGLGGDGGIGRTGIFSMGDSGVRVAVQSDGKILVAGVDNSSNENFVARFIATPVPVNPVPTLDAPGFVLLALLMLLAVDLVAGKRKRQPAAPMQTGR